MRFPILLITEPHFKAASGEAAVYELRLRLLAGTLSSTANMPIDITLSKLLTSVLDHFKPTLKADDIDLLKKACSTRNKLLHCEFSAARKRMNELNPKVRDGGVLRLETGAMSGPSLRAKITDAISGHQVGQVPVGHTNTRTLKDVVGWLIECQGAHEFEEAVKVFQDAIAILDRLSCLIETNSELHEGG